MSADARFFVERLHVGGVFAQQGADGRATLRQPIIAEEVWVTEFAAVPVDNPLPSETSADGDTAAGGAVVIRKGLLLEPDPAGPAPYRYRAQAPGDIRKAIPATWGINSQFVAQRAGSYAPELRGASGARVPYDSTVWVLDGSLHVLEFIPDESRPGQLPPGADPPFTLTYWEYGGPTAGSGGGGGGVAGGANLGAGAEVFRQTTLGGVMEFRTLAPGAGIASLQGPSEIELHSGVLVAAQAGHGLALGQAVYWTGGAWAVARADSVTTLATHLVARVPGANEVWLTNTGTVSLGAPHGFAPGTWLYASAAAAGALSSLEPPPPAFSNPVALALSASELLAFSFRSSLAGGATPGAPGGHYRGAAAVFEGAGGAGPAAPAPYGAAGSPAAAGFSPGAPSVARWSAAAPLGYSGGGVTVELRFAAPIGGAVAFRAGTQPLSAGASVGAFAPTYGAAVPAPGAGAATVAGASLSAGGGGLLAPGEPFWLFIERATGDPGDTAVGAAAVHDIFLTF